MSSSLWVFWVFQRLFAEVTPGPEQQVGLHWRPLKGPHMLTQKLVSYLHSRRGSITMFKLKPWGISQLLCSLCTHTYSKQTKDLCQALWRMGEREREQREQKMGQSRKKEHYVSRSPGWRQVRSPEGGKRVVWYDQQPQTTTRTLPTVKAHREQVKKKRTEERASGDAHVPHQGAKEVPTWAWC